MREPLIRGAGVADSGESRESTQPRATPAPDRLTLTVPEAARLLGVGRTLLYRELQDGHLPHVRLGRRILVPREALARWLAAGGMPGAQA